MMFYGVLQESKIDSIKKKIDDTFKNIKENLQSNNIKDTLKATDNYFSIVNGKYKSEIINLIKYIELINKQIKNYLNGSKSYKIANPIKLDKSKFNNIENLFNDFGGMDKCTVTNRKCFEKVEVKEDYNKLINDLVAITNKYELAVSNITFSSRLEKQDVKTASDIYTIIYFLSNFGMRMSIITKGFKLITA